MAKYEDAPDMTEYPEQACKRAAWLLNSLALDVTKYKRITMKEFNAAYSALQSLNIPVHCKQTTKKKKPPYKIKEGVERSIRCFCYPPTAWDNVEVRPLSKEHGGYGPEEVYHGT